MHSILTIGGVLIRGIGIFWLALTAYGFVRKDKETDKKRGRGKLSNMDGFDGGQADDSRADGGTD